MGLGPEVGAGIDWNHITCKPKARGTNKYTETIRGNRELAEEVSFTETRSCVVPGAGGA